MHRWLRYWSVLSTLLEKCGRSERDKLCCHQSVKLIILPSSDAQPLYYLTDRQALSIAWFCRACQLATADNCVLYWNDCSDLKTSYCWPSKQLDPRWCHNTKSWSDKQTSKMWLDYGQQKQQEKSLLPSKNRHYVNDWRKQKQTYEQAIGSCCSLFLSLNLRHYATVKLL